MQAGCQVPEATDGWPSGQGKGRLLSWEMVIASHEIERDMRSTLGCGRRMRSVCRPPGCHLSIARPPSLLRAHRLPASLASTIRVDSRLRPDLHNETELGREGIVAKRAYLSSHPIHPSMSKSILSRFYRLDMWPFHFKCGSLVACPHFIGVGCLWRGQRNVQNRVPWRLVVICHHWSNASFKWPMLAGAVHWTPTLVSKCGHAIN